MFTQLMSLLLVGAGAGPGWTTEVPEALRNFERARANIRTAVVDCRETRWTQYEPLEPVRHVIEVLDVSNGTLRLAGEDTIWINRGDDEGVMVRDVAGNPSSMYTHPRHFLQDGGTLWQHEETVADATGFTPEKPNMEILHIRSLGASSGLCSQDIQDVLYREGGSVAPAEYMETVEDGLHVVTAKIGDDTVRQWWVDPARGWNVIRTTYDVDGERLLELRAGLAQFDGVWFPETISVYNRQWCDGKEPFETLQVSRAEFNRPEHPQDFTPADIGMHTGMMVNIRSGTLEEVGHGVFDGTKVVRVTVYERERIDALQAQMQRGEKVEVPDWQAALKTTVTYESEWEAYTREFIAKYQLDEGQSQRAWTILKDCQEQADLYLLRNRARLSSLEQRLRAKPSGDEAKRKAEEAALGEMLHEVCAPVEQIFEARLKPRLDRLPTRSQRVAAGE